MRNPIRNALLALAIVGIGGYAVVDRLPQEPAIKVAPARLSVSGAPEAFRAFVEEQRAAGRKLPIVHLALGQGSAKAVVDIDDPRQIDAVSRDALRLGLSTGMTITLPPDAPKLMLEKLKVPAAPKS